MSVPTLVLGDDTDLTVNLVDEDGVAWDVSTATSIKVALVMLDRSALLMSAIAASAVYAGAAWGSGTVVVPITGTLSTVITVSQAEVEVQVVIGARTYTALGTKKLALVKGLIT